MYYEEELINGIACCRYDPMGIWHQIHINKLSQDYFQQKQMLIDASIRIDKMESLIKDSMEAGKALASAFGKGL